MRSRASANGRDRARQGPVLARSLVSTVLLDEPSENARVATENRYIWNIQVAAQGGVGHLPAPVRVRIE
jgi:hypothetical protein